METQQDIVTNYILMTNEWNICTEQSLNHMYVPNLSFIWLLQLQQKWRRNSITNIMYYPVLIEVAHSWQVLLEQTQINHF